MTSDMTVWPSDPGIKIKIIQRLSSMGSKLLFNTIINSEFN